MKQLLFSCMHRTSECPSFISSCQFKKRSKRWIVSTSDSKEDGCTVIAMVFTRSHPEPGSQAHLRQFRYCGARAHGNVCHCAPLSSLGRIPSRRLATNRPHSAMSGMRPFQIFKEKRSEGTINLSHLKGAIEHANYDQ